MTDRQLAIAHIDLMHDYVDEGGVPVPCREEVEAKANQLLRDLAGASSDSQVEEVVEMIFDVAVNVYKQFTEDEFYAVLQVTS